MRIEAITVSIGCGDILAHTVRENQHLLDDLVVVTSPDDDETREVCRRYSVRHVLTDDHLRGGPFNKARLIQRGFDQIGSKDWVLHLDADIVLPRRFRDFVEWAHPKEECIYGADRQNVVGYDAWMRLKESVGGWDNHAFENGHWFHPILKTGSRWVSKLHGYVPIGAFQFFHGTAMIQNGYHVRHYPYHHGDAARTDIQFALQWDRRQRLVLPEVIVLHLESEHAAMGTNWCGRKTVRFGPERGLSGGMARGVSG